MQFSAFCYRQYTEHTKILWNLLCSLSSRYISNTCWSDGQESQQSFRWTIESAFQTTFLIMWVHFNFLIWMVLFV